MKYTEVVIQVDKIGMQLRDQETLLIVWLYKMLPVGCVPESSICFDDHDSKSCKEKALGDSK